MSGRLKAQVRWQQVPLGLAILVIEQKTWPLLCKSAFNYNQYKQSQRHRIELGVLQYQRLEVHRHRS